MAVEAVQTLADTVGLPEWVQPFSILLLLVSFPIVMATAFVQEGVGGQKAAAPVSHDPVDGARTPPKEARGIEG